MTSAREHIKTLREKQSAPDMDFADGISLLSLKHQLMLGYIHSLALLNAHRALGHSLSSDYSHMLPGFASSERGKRGSEPADLVASTVEGRLVLEKIKVLEGRMRYQIEKLVRLAEEAPAAEGALNDPLAFRPNPQALAGAASSSESEEGSDAEAGKPAIYRPPRLAPMPYTDVPPPKDKSRRRAPVPSSLAALAHLDPSAPHAESSSGLGAAPAHASARARELGRMTEYEEENFTRLVMKKSAARRRVRDEEDVALGGTGLGARVAGRRGRGGGLEDEFADVLRSVGRGSKTADAYDELRQRGRRGGALERARGRKRDVVEELGVDEPRVRKKGRFELETKAAKRRLSRK
ncbi:hypothetical protein K488DRAFT_86547 [Vararia minispora EC-137]|uniref:Uncharacterized protein n=1 Tax=Vararia minispora EC-137 TaxID=1314806 RepID=A0ACB8QJG5_9AGAM|nr:hypothetical protein K488DRAFT_86547 [Vararia minispora EC-137]